MDSKRLPIWIGALLGAGLCLSPATAAAQPRVTEVQVTPPNGTVLVNQTMYFSATAFNNGSALDFSSFAWSSSNPRVATVDSHGMATGVGPGSATISARAGSTRTAKSGHATLVVTSEEAQPQPQPQAVAPPAAPRGAAPAPPAAAGPRLPGQGCAAADREPPGSGPAIGLEIDPLQVKLVKGEARQLIPRPIQASGETADHLCVVFLVQPGGEKAATVDTFGMVLAQGDTGHAIIQVTVPGKAFLPKQVSVEVRGDSVRFRAPELSMVPGEVDTLQLLVPAQGNRPVNPLGFQFQSSDPTKVRVSSILPVVTAVAAGRARVVAQSTFYPEIPIWINVHRRVTRLAITPADTLFTLAMGAQTTLGARPLAADTSAVTEVPMRWTVEDTTVVRFDTATKVVRGLKMGQTRITVSVPVAHDTTTSWHWWIKVIAGGLAISRPGPRVALGVGERMPVEVKLLDDRRQPIETASRLTWTSTGDSIARVVDGQIEGVGMGRARLTARAPWDSTATTDVTVVGDLLVKSLRAGRSDIYMLQHGENGQLPKLRQMTTDSGTNAIRSSPAWSPTLTQIAFVMSPVLNGNSDLYIEDADGSSQRRLTHDTATVAAPSFVGPSGDQIVFESSKSGKAQLYVMKADGTGRRQLTTGDNPNTQPSVSPDGKKVLFTSMRDRNYDIYEIGLDGTGERRLTTSPRPEDHPQYAADGLSFYYLREENDSPRSKRVYHQDLVSGTVAPGAPGAQAAPATPLTPEHLYVSEYSVSADGSTLALFVVTQDANGVQVYRVETFNVATQVRTPLTLPGADRVSDPVFRPATPPQH